jgi:putative oxidoreductase
MLRGDWNSVGLAWLRILAGSGIATHGFGKIFGGHMEGFAQGVAQMGFPVPALFAWAAALSEFAGGICVAVGIGTRIAALFIFGTMSVALFLHHAADPFDVKELAYLYWSIAGALIMLGGGAYTLPSLIARRHR